MTLTYGDEQLSLAAARAALAEIRNRDVCGHLRQIGEQLVAEVQASIDESGVPFACRGEPAMPAFVATGVFKGRPLDSEEQAARGWTIFSRSLPRRGILWRKHSLLLPSYSHSTSDVDLAAAACREVFAALAGLLDAGRLHEAVPLTQLPVGFRRL